MPAEIDEQKKAEIVKLRAMDYTKKEIADELDISRNTVSRHLKEVRKEAEESDNPDEVILRKVATAAAGAGAAAGLAIILKKALDEWRE